MPVPLRQMGSVAGGHQANPVPVAGLRSDTTHTAAAWMPAGTLYTSGMRRRRLASCGILAVLPPGSAVPPKAPVAGKCAVGSRGGELLGIASAFPGLRCE